MRVPTNSIKVELPVKQNKKSQSNILGYVFVLPAVAFVAVFIVYGIFFLVKTSFYKVDISFLNPEFIGLDNFKIALADKKFYRSLFNNVVLAAVTIFFCVTLGFLFSVFLCFKLKGTKIYRTLFFVPTLLPNALIAAVFAGMLQYSHGTLNRMLRAIGLDFLAQRWLADPGWAYFSVMIISFYFIGMAMMYYTADLSTISPSIFESAIIDGANMRDMLLRIIFPLLINSHKTVTLTMMLTSFRAFERVFILTGGGPGYSTQITGTYIYSFFAGESAIGNIGFVSTISIFVLIVAFIIGSIQLRAYSRASSQ